MATQEQNFVDQQLRPICEQMRAIDVRVAALATALYAGVNALVPNDGTAYDDGRTDQGLTPMVGSDIHNAVANLLGILAGTAAYNTEVISKPTVRTIEVV